jgi:tetratricopeptide (TPR) repeat protein
LFRSLADRRGQARALVGMGDVEREQGRVEDALDLFNRALPMLREIGGEVELAKALSSHGLTLAANGDRAAATVAWKEALRILRQWGAPEASTVEQWLRR